MIFIDDISELDYYNSNGNVNNECYCEIIADPLDILLQAIYDGFDKKSVYKTKIEMWSNDGLTKYADVSSNFDVSIYNVGSTGYANIRSRKIPDEMCNQKCFILKVTITTNKIYSIGTGFDIREETVFSKFTQMYCVQDCCVPVKDITITTEPDNLQVTSISRISDTAYKITGTGHGTLHLRDVDALTLNNIYYDFDVSGDYTYTYTSGNRWEAGSDGVTYKQAKALYFNGTNAYTELANITDWMLDTIDEYEIIFKPVVVKNYELMSKGRIGSNGNGYMVSDISTDSGMYFYTGSISLRNPINFPTNYQSYKFTNTVFDASNITLAQYSDNILRRSDTVPNTSLVNPAIAFRIGRGGAGSSVSRFFNGYVYSIRKKTDIFDFNTLSIGDTSAVSSGGTVMNFTNVTVEIV